MSCIKYPQPTGCQSPKDRMTSQTQNRVRKTGPSTGVVTYNEPMDKMESVCEEIFEAMLEQYKKEICVEKYNRLENGAINEWALLDGREEFAMRAEHGDQVKYFIGKKFLK